MRNHNEDTSASEKNLLIITPSYPNSDNSYMGGSFVKNQVAELKKNCKEVIVISPVLKSLGYFSNDKLCMEYHYDNVHVYYPRCYYIPIFWLRKPVIDNRLTVIRKTISENNLHFNLIHAHFTWPSGFIGIKLKEMLDTPLVTTIHENGEWFEKEIHMNHPMLIAAWKGADVLIRVNKKDLPILSKFNDSVYSIPNGYSDKLYPTDSRIAQQQVGINHKNKIVFTLGNLVKRKGFNYLIEAMKIISERRKDVVCYIGGVGPEKNNLLKMINKLNLEANVILIGAIPDDQLNYWINSCDLFALPSLNEGNPTVMFEALGCGKPFIGTKVGGVPEVITSDEYGLLVEPANSEDLAEKILIALDRQWDEKKILDHAAQYTWENVAIQIMNVYEQVLKETPQ